MHLPFALAGYFLNGVSVLLSKFIITKEIKSPFVYLTYVSTFSLLALLFLPWTNIPSLPVLILASLYTITWSIGAYLVVSALKIGQVDQVIPINGTLIPALLLISALSTQSITYSQAWAVLVLMGGLLFLTIPDWQGRAIKKELLLAVLSSIFFALAYTILRQAFLMENFLTVFVWSRTILIPVGLMLLVVPKVRALVLTSPATGINFFSRVGWLFILNQLFAGSGELLLNFSIFLASPALVNSLQGSQFAFLFLASLILARKYPQVFKENGSIVSIGSKTVGLLLVGIGLFFLATR